MKPLWIMMIIAAAGAVVAAFVVVLSGTGSDSVPREPVARSKSVLVDVHGAVLEELSSDCTSSRFPYFCAHATKELRAIDRRLLEREGLTIKTTLDPRVQTAAQQAVDAHVNRDDPQVAMAAMIVPGTGEIRAMAASHGSGHAPGFPQGSTAMVYPLAAALEKGMRDDEGFNAGTEYRAASMAAFKNCAGARVSDTTHSILNKDGADGGHTTLRTGTRDQVNTFFMKLTERVGLCETVTMARRLGLERADGHPLGEYMTFALGINEVEPVSVAASYATLAARGRHCVPRAVTEIRDQEGAVRALPPRCQQVIEPAVAEAVTRLLSEALAGSTVKGIGRDAAGLPGTTDSYTAAWYAGYTPDLAAAVGLGDPRHPYRHPLVDVTIGGRTYPFVTGTSIPGHIWKAAMAAAHSGQPETGFVSRR